MRVSGAIPERVVVAYEDALGNPVDVSEANALPTSGGGGGSGGSGPTGAAVPADASYIAYGDLNSNLTGVSEATPLPVNSYRADNLVEMLARIVKLLESNAVVDSAQRQRITIDAGTLPAVTTVSTVTTVTTVSTVTAANNLVANAGMDREQYINIARNTYANAIRPQLIFT